MKKKFSAIHSAALLLGSIGAAPAFAAETSSTQNISPGMYIYHSNAEKLQDHV